jgi:sugar phosphate isomerase/epimerase
MIKLSLCSINFHTAFSKRGDKVTSKVEEIIPQVASLGFDGIEIWGRHLEGKSLPEIKKIKELTQEHNLEIPVISPYFDFTDTEEKWEESFNRALKFIEYSYYLGKPMIRFFSGRVGSERASPEQWRKACRALRQICNIAETYKIKIAAEIHDNNLMDTVPSTLRLLKEINKENLGIIFQPHSFSPLEVITSFEETFPYIFHIHLCNFTQEQKYSLLSEGIFDIKSFVKKVTAKNFKGYLSLEFWKTPLLEVARSELEYLRSLIKER